MKRNELNTPILCVGAPAAGRRNIDRLLQGFEPPLIVLTPPSHCPVITTGLLERRGFSAGIGIPEKSLWLDMSLDTVHKYVSHTVEQQLFNGRRHFVVEVKYESGDRAWGFFRKMRLAKKWIAKQVDVPHTI